jgi:hypothetical protein
MRPQPFKIRKRRGTVECEAAPMDWLLTVVERNRFHARRRIRPGSREEHRLFALMGGLRRHWRARHSERMRARRLT